MFDGKSLGGFVYRWPWRMEDGKCQLSLDFPFLSIISSPEATVIKCAEFGKLFGEFSFSSK